MKGGGGLREKRKGRDHQPHPKGFQHHAHEHQPQEGKCLAALGRSEDREQFMGGGWQWRKSGKPARNRFGDGDKSF